MQNKRDRISIGWFSYCLQYSVFFFFFVCINSFFSLIGILCVESQIDRIKPWRKNQEYSEIYGKRMQYFFNVFFLYLNIDRMGYLCVFKLFFCFLIDEWELFDFEWWIERHTLWPHVKQWFLFSCTDEYRMPRFRRDSMIISVKRLSVAQFQLNSGGRRDVSFG